MSADQTTPPGGVTAERVRGVVVVRMPAGSNLTAEEAPAVRAALEAHAAGEDELIFDLGDVRFVDSSGIGTIVGVSRTLDRTGGQLRLARPSREASAAFELVRLHRLLEIHPTVQDAVDHATGSAP